MENTFKSWGIGKRQRGWPADESGEIPHGRPGKSNGCSFRLIVMLGLSSAPFLAQGATQSVKMPVTPKWGRFEHAFTSSATYTNPLQEVTLTVQFISPLGEKAQVYGFWDGGRTWRVRFAPDQPGRWIYRTTCSDSGNTGLHGQAGAFLCTSSLGQSPFRRHGLVQVAKDRHHLEYGDGTPFFWLADTVNRAALIADMRSWSTYAVIRSSQNFNVAQWSVTSGGNLEHESALTGFPERIGINPDFFKRLDARLDVLSEAGILSAISPLAQPEPDAVALPESQLVLLARYVVARWGAEPVAWLLAPGKDSKQIERWRKVGTEVFSGMRHAPVVVYASDPETLQAFAEQPWADVLGVQMPFDRDRGEILDRLSKDHPVLAFTPHENAVNPKNRTRVSADEVRQSAYCGLLMTPPAGVSYAGLGIENWDTTVESKKEDPFGAGLPLWQKALFMPGAKQLSQMAQLFSSVDFWRLRPNAAVLGTAASSTTCPAATPTKDLEMVYVANERMLELALAAMPHSPTVTWFNPRQGGNSPAVAVVVQEKCQFPTPAAGDWVLLLKAGK